MGLADAVNREAIYIAAAGRTPFMILAGDFLSPSVASNVLRETRNAA